MITRHLLLIISFIICAISCSYAIDDFDLNPDYLFKIEPGSEPKIGIVGKSAYYRGELIQKAVKELIEMSRKTPIEKLVINSGGGNVMAGMDLGEWVFKNKMDVEIPYMCTSSCANYVFVAGKTKILGQFSFIGWHGNAHQKTGFGESDIDRYAEQAMSVCKSKPDDVLCKNKTRDQTKTEIKNIYRKDIEIKISRERDFFEMVGVDLTVCLLKEILPLNIKEINDWGSYYTLSIKDMERFGIKNVVAFDGEYPRKGWANSPVVVNLKDYIKDIH